MTLKEKLVLVIQNHNTVEVISDEVEKIADEFAVEFAEWVLSRSLGETVQLKDDTLDKFKFVKGL